MTLQSSGQISFQDIINEFGNPGGGGFGAYRVSQNVGELTNLGLDNNTNNPPTSRLPQSGQISFSDMYGKKLNIVVDHHTSGSGSFRMNARSRYNSNGVTVIGGFRGRPTNTTGKRVIIHVNRSIGSEKGGENDCALRTGGWEGSTELSVDVGGEGEILGAGGNGGNGSREEGSNGGEGTSGLGVQYNPTHVNIRSGGIISCGYGGGGGGGGGHDHDKNSERHAGGGGGGGGQGWPAGNGGSGAEGSEGADGGNGSAGNKDEAGEGGHGSDNEEEAEGGSGGEGGHVDESAEGGGRGDGGEGSENPGGAGGGNGAAIRRNSGITVHIDNSGTVRGSTTATGVN